MEIHLVLFLLCKQPIVWAIPAAILWICMRVIWQASQPLVSSNGSKIPPVRVNYVVDSLGIRQQSPDMSFGRADRPCHRPA